MPTHPPLHDPTTESKTLLQKWINLDWVGTILSLGMTVSLLLALQWGGVQKPWNDRVIIALFVLVRVVFVTLKPRLTCLVIERCLVHISCAMGTQNWGPRYDAIVHFEAADSGMSCFVRVPNDR